MIKLKKAEKPSIKLKKAKKTKLVKEPIRVMISTCPGTKHDAESLARSQIERYFDVTSNSWFYMQEESGVGVHIEIHEGGAGRPLLPSLLQMKRSPDEPIVIIPLNGNAVEVSTREDNTLQSIIMSDSQSKSAEATPGIEPSSKLRMKPYVTMGSEWIKVGVLALSLGLLTITVGGVLHKSFDIALQGYDEIVETLPSERLLELSGFDMAKSTQLIQPISKLPVSQWDRLINQPLGPDQRVSKLTFKDGKWDIEVLDFVEDAPLMEPPKEDSAKSQEGDGPGVFNSEGVEVIQHEVAKKMLDQHESSKKGGSKK